MPLAYVQAEPIRSITKAGQRRNASDILEDLRRIPRGVVGWGYLDPTDENVDFLCRPDRVNYFLYRDPRDLLVSQVFFATDMYEDHGMHEYYNSLPDFGSRLNVAITGIDRDGLKMVSVKQRYEGVLQWLQTPRRPLPPLRGPDRSSRRDSGHHVGRGGKDRLSNPDPASGGTAAYCGHRCNPARAARFVLEKLAAGASTSPPSIAGFFWTLPETSWYAWAMKRGMTGDCSAAPLIRARFSMSVREFLTQRLLRGTVRRLNNLRIAGAARRVDRLSPEAARTAGRLLQGIHRNRRPVLEQRLPSVVVLGAPPARRARRVLRVPRRNESLCPGHQSRQCSSRPTVPVLHPSIRDPLRGSAGGGRSGLTRREPRV